MTETAFPVEEIVLKRTPRSCEPQLRERNIGPEQGETLQQPPEDLLEVDPPEKYQGLDVVVIGPSYGDIIVKFTDNGEAVDRFNYQIIDEDLNKVVTKTDRQTVPSLADAALLKAGWFCADWGEKYTISGTDYLSTLGAACKHLAKSGEFDEESAAESDIEEMSLFPSGGFQPDNVASLVHGAVMGVYCSKRLTNGTCHEELKKEIEHHIDADEMVGPSDAVSQIINERDEDQSTAQQPTVIRPSGGGEENPADQVVHQLTQHGTVTDFPNVCTTFLREFGPETDSKNYWEQGLTTDQYFHLPHRQVDDRYLVTTELTEKRGEEILQVAVITADFAFYEEFKKVGESKYITSNASNGLPAIYCAAVVREMGGEINSLPSLDEPSVEELYVAIAEIVVKIFKENPDLHNGALQKLDSVTSTIRSEAIGKTSKTETVDQGDLPANATGDGLRQVVSRDQFEEGLAGRLPNGISKLSEAAGD